MRVILQRSKDSCVKVSGKIVGKIDYGVVLLVGFTFGDGAAEIDYMIDKIVNLRIFDNESGKMDKCLLDVGGAVLSVSQFTLYADIKKGRRPAYSKALPFESAKKLYLEFNEKLKRAGILVESGIFGSTMEVMIKNDGPVTVILEKENENE